MDAPDRDISTIHIRCGSDIRAALRIAGFAGEFLEYSDPLCRGPVPQGNSLETARAAFLSQAYRLDPARVAARLAAERDGIARARQSERVVLWFEHDSYDQLILARLLAAFSSGRRPRILEAVIVDSAPGIERFIGLGMLTPQVLRGLWDDRRPVTAAVTHLGSAVWSALRRPDPSRLFEIAAAGCPAIPLMAPALIRHLQELPWIGDGLSLTQRLALQALAAGHSTGGAIFRHLHDHAEPLPFLGDMMFWADLADMAAAADPPFRAVDPACPWPDRALLLTGTGRALAEGTRDWRKCGAPPRWVGGVEIASGRADWRWSQAAGRPVLAG